MIVVAGEYRLLPLSTFAFQIMFFKSSLVLLVAGSPMVPADNDQLRERAGEPQIAASDSCLDARDNFVVEAYNPNILPVDDNNMHHNLIIRGQKIVSIHCRYHA